MSQSSPSRNEHPSDKDNCIYRSSLDDRRSSSTRSSCSLRCQRDGSPNFKEGRRITSARKKPIPYDRKRAQSNSSAESSSKSSSDSTSQSATSGYKILKKSDSPTVRRIYKFRKSSCCGDIDRLIEEK